MDKRLLYVSRDFHIVYFYCSDGFYLIFISLWLRTRAEPLRCVGELHFTNGSEMVAE